MKKIIACALILLIASSPFVSGESASEPGRCPNLINLPMGRNAPCLRGNYPRVGLAAKTKVLHSNHYKPLLLSGRAESSKRLLEDASGHCNKNQPARKVHQNYCERLEK